MKRTLTLTCLATLLMLVAAGCVTGGGGGQPAASEPIKIGALVPLSGAASEGGQRMKNAFELAAEEINNSGGVLGRQVELVFYDTEGNSEKAVAGAKRLIEQDQVWGLVGGYVSGAVLAMVDVPMENKKVFVDTVAAAPQITGLVKDDYDKYKYLFRTGAHVNHFALNTMPFVTDITQAKTYYYIAQDALWAKALGGVFENMLSEKGVQKVGESFVQRGTEEFASIIPDIKAKDPDVVISALVSAEGVPFAKQYYDAQVPAPFITTAGVLTFEDAIKGMGDKGNYVNFMAWAWDVPLTSKTQPFYKEYKERYEALPSGYEDVRSYDGLLVLAEGIRQANSLEPDKVVEALEKIEFEGVAGKYVFDEEHQAKQGEGYLVGVLGQWRDGQAVIFFPDNVATGQFQTASWWK